MLLLRRLFREYERVIFKSIISSFVLNIFIRGVSFIAGYSFNYFELSTENFELPLHPFLIFMLQILNNLIKSHGNSTQDHNGGNDHVQLEEMGYVNDKNVYPNGRLGR